MFKKIFTKLFKNMKNTFFPALLASTITLWACATNSPNTDLSRIDPSKVKSLECPNSSQGELDISALKSTVAELLDNCYGDDYNFRVPSTICSELTTKANWEKVWNVRFHSNENPTKNLDGLYRKLGKPFNGTTYNLASHVLKNGSIEWFGAYRDYGQEVEASLDTVHETNVVGHCITSTAKDLQEALDEDVASSN